VTCPTDTATPGGGHSSGGAEEAAGIPTASARPLVMASREPWW
jgi:hypothetical protein